MSQLLSRKSLALMVALTSTVGSSIAVAPAAHAATNFSAVNVGPRAGATRIPVNLGGSLSGSVDMGTGNLMLSTSDALVPGAKGSTTALGLSFNSLAATNGWTAPILAGLVQNDDGSILLTDKIGRAHV